MKKNEELLEHASFGKLVLNLCVPSIVIMLVMVIYNMADTFFIGQTGDPNKIAAISLCSPVIYRLIRSWDIVWKWWMYCHLHCTRKKGS